MTHTVSQSESSKDDNKNGVVSQTKQVKQRIAAIDSFFAKPAPTEPIIRKDKPFELRKPQPENKLSGLRKRALENWQELKALLPEILQYRQQLARQWKSLSLRHKSMALAIALTTVPIVTVGSLAHLVVKHSLEAQIIAQQENRVLGVERRMGEVADRLIEDVETVASSPMLADRELSSKATLAQKIQLLDGWIDVRNEQYDSIVVFDVQGNVLFQSKSPNPVNAGNNYSNREYFKAAIASQDLALSEPKITLSSNTNSLEVASPIKEFGTGKLLGVVRLRMSLTYLDNKFAYLDQQGLEYRLIGADGIVFAADEPQWVGQKADGDFYGLTQLELKVKEQLATRLPGDNKTPVKSETLWDNNDAEKVLVSVAPIEGLNGLRDTGWNLAISRPLDEALAPLAKERWILLLGTTTATLLVGAIAVKLADRLTKPILAAASAVHKMGQGNLKTRLEITGEDEFTVLGSNINNMARKLDGYLEKTTTEARRSHLFKEITIKIAGTLDRSSILNTTVTELQKALKCDRVIVYRFDKYWKGRIVSEAVTDNCPRILGTELVDPCFAEHTVEKYKQGRVRAINNIYKAGLSECHIQQMASFNVKANLVAPLNVGGELIGLLIAHQCLEPRNWDDVEIDFFAQTAIQVGLALDRAKLLEEQKLAKEQLQKRALSLLMEVEPISKGDLTIRAKVTDDEVGTLADSYNSTVENLCKIVKHVKAAAQQVAIATNQNNAVAQALTEGAEQQSEEIAAALQRIQAMTDSILAVASSVEQAETAVRHATKAVETGDNAMNRTVDGMKAIQQTTAQTAKKVKKLGESSQEISKVISLISSFASQTNLLALNASIEAARAGEEGRGFAIVAEEVRALAQQSAEATGEIEKIVATIQRETKEVVAAMEEGTEHAIAGSELVDETRTSLNQIEAVSNQLDDLIAAIAKITVAQSEDSKIVSHTMARVARMSQTTSTEMNQVSTSYKDLLSLAKELQEQVSQFKVN
ncbi:MAG: methyl-accepting chemotaxis protein [Hydrococcus sp. Prado102]|jgi:methyl-accepting chemotaxis protein PixJ|nr:methyl-accepting chemotaxis protein [Hydrococcus sp. Prado102]